MARGLCVGSVLVITMLSGQVRAGGGPAPIHTGGDVRFASGLANNESTLTAEGLGVRVSKRVGQEKVRIRIETRGDAIDLETDAMLRVKVSRRGRSVSLQMKARDAERLAEVKRLTDGSAALRAFDALVERLKDDGRDVAKSVMTSWAIIHALRGSEAPALELARRLAPAPAPKGSPFTRASVAAGAGPVACWMEYAYSVSLYMNEYLHCYENYGWIPGMVAVCTFEWLVKVELAWFWVITCSGGMPV